MSNRLLLPVLAAVAVAGSAGCRAKYFPPTESKVGCDQLMTDCTIPQIEGLTPEGDLNLTDPSENVACEGIVARCNQVRGAALQAAQDSFEGAKETNRMLGIFVIGGIMSAIGAGVVAAIRAARKGAENK